MKAVLFLCLGSVAIFGQALDELKSKYGPAVSETFSVRPSIGVKVRTNSQGAVAEMLISPMSTDSLIESRSMTFSYETAKSLVDELLPHSSRGKFLIAAFVDAVCLPENDCWGSSEDYENVSVHYNSSAKPGQVCYVDVRFKNRRTDPRSNGAK
jgi:hypothetical protein